MVKTNKEFKAVKPGEVYPSTIAAGTEVEGRLAQIAAQLNAVEVPAQKSAPKRKAHKGAPENKAG